MGNPSSDQRFSDNDIWHLLKNGSREAVSLLVYRYYDDLLRYGCSFCTNTIWVEDLIQDLFCELCQKPGNLAQVNFIKPYLFKALRRRLFRKSQQERKFVRIEGEEDRGLLFEIEFSAEELIVHREQKEEMTAKIGGYVQQLSARQREAIYLRFYENLSYEAISEVMGITVPYLYLLIHKSIGRIRKLAGKFEY